MHVIKIHLLSILSTPFFEPKASSSAMSRVTAVLIPLTAKVEASIYTEKII